MRRRRRRRMRTEDEEEDEELQQNEDEHDDEQQHFRFRTRFGFSQCSQSASVQLQCAMSDRASSAPAGVVAARRLRGKTSAGSSGAYNTASGSSGASQPAEEHRITLMGEHASACGASQPAEEQAGPQRAALSRGLQKLVEDLKQFGRIPQRKKGGGRRRTGGKQAGQTSGKKSQEHSE